MFRDIYSLHTTANNISVPIISMDRDHLIATIRLHLRKIKEIRDVLNGSAQADALYELYMDKSGVDRKALKEELSRRLNLLQPYVFMAMWHGINLSADIVNALGDSEAYAGLSETRALIAAEDEEDDDLYEMSYDYGQYH